MHSVRHAFAVVWDFQQLTGDVRNFILLTLIMLGQIGEDDGLTSAGARTARRRALAL